MPERIHSSASNRYAQKRQQVLKDIHLGTGVAERESDSIKSFFVKTHQWEQVIDGESDLIFGEKGSGKSAIYSHLRQLDGDFFDNGIIIMPAENSTGREILSDLVNSPPESEEQFRSFWKLYFLSLVGRAFSEYRIENSDANQIMEYLREQKIIRGSFSLNALLRSSIEYRELSG